MPKGIIIHEIDEIPEDCYHCSETDDTGWCRHAQIFVDHRTEPGRRYVCCPIIPMPEREKLDDPYDEYGTGYTHGYNACIDKLMGE